MGWLPFGPWRHTDLVRELHRGSRAPPNGLAGYLGLPALAYCHFGPIAPGSPITVARAPGDKAQHGLSPSDGFLGCDSLSHSDLCRCTFNKRAESLGHHDFVAHLHASGGANSPRRRTHVRQSNGNCHRGFRHIRPTDKRRPFPAFAPAVFSR